MNVKDNNINCSVNLHHVFLSLFVFTWLENQTFFCLIYLFFQNLIFQIWYSAYLHVQLIHRLLWYWYQIIMSTTRLLKCTMFLLIIIIMIIILQRSGD